MFMSSILEAVLSLGTLSVPLELSPDMRRQTQNPRVGASLKPSAISPSYAAAAAITPDQGTHRSTTVRGIVSCAWNGTGARV